MRVWDLSTAAAPPCSKATRAGQSVALERDGRTALSGSKDDTVRVWDLSTGRCTAVLEGHTDGVHSVAMTPTAAPPSRGAGTIRCGCGT